MADADGSGRIEFLWGDGLRPFRLGLGEIRELQAKTGYGPERLCERIVAGDWHTDELAETVRLGLMGAGTSLAEAHVLVNRHVHGKPADNNKVSALAILLAYRKGPEHDIVKKTIAAMDPTKTPPTREDASPSLQSTESAAPSV